jgi:hypothetical protein
MIRIILGDTDLDTTEASLRWESVNSLFNDDLQGDYSFPFTLKNSDVNMKALGFANLADVPTKSVTFPCVLILDTTSIRSNLIINGTNRNGFNVNIAGGIKGLINADKSLKDLPFYISSTGEGRIDLASDFSNMPLYKYVDWNLAIAFPPHYNPAFYGTANPDFQGVVNRMDATTGTFLVNSIAGETGNKYCIVPFLYIHYILKTIAAENGMTLSGTYASDSEIQSALLYNNYALDKKEDQGCIVKAAGTEVIHMTFATPGSVLTLADTFTGCSNSEGNFHNGDHKYHIPADGDYSLKLDIAFKGIYNGAGNDSSFLVVLKSENYGFLTSQSFNINPDDLDSTTLIIAYPGATAPDTFYVWIESVDNTDPALNVIDVQVTSATLTIARYDLDDFNIMDQNVILKNHVPNMKVSDFLLKIKNWAQVEITPDWQDLKLIMNFAEKTIKNTHEIDLTDIADPNYELVFDDKSNGFVLSYDFGSNDTLIEGNFKSFDRSKLLGEFPNDAISGVIPLGSFAIAKNKNKVMQYDGFSWVEYCDDYYPVSEGKAGSERLIELAPMMMTDLQENESSTDNADHKKCLMPAISEAGSSVLFGLGTNDASLRVVFMHGQNQYETVGGKYIYASPTNYDLNGYLIGAYNLKLQGDDGWYVRYLQKILLAIDNSAVFEYLIMLPASYLRYRGKVQIKNVNYLVKNVTMLAGTFIKQSVVKLLKL